MNRHLFIAAAIAMSVLGCSAADPSASNSANGDAAATQANATGSNTNGAASGAAQSSSAGAGQPLALSATLPTQCTGSSEIVRIDRPVSSSDEAMGSFSYGFRFKAPQRPDAPVLVYLPGGPGMTSTDTVPDFLPSDWGYLLTDPRGVGCNTLATTPSGALSSAFFRSEEVANDVIAAIQDRKLGGNYVLYGISYGTLLGVTVAHGLETKNVTAPSAVILEGVLGRAIPDTEFGAAEFIHQWDLLRAQLPDDVLNELDTKDAPYGFTADEWSRALSQILLGGPSIMVPLFTALSDAIPTDIVRNEMLDQIRSYADARILTDPNAVELYRQIACREIGDSTPASDLDVIFVKGKLVRNRAEEGTKCGSLHLTTPYDSAQLQFSAKLYEFIGEGDPATPVAQGAYMFDHHNGHVVRVITDGGGHLSLQLNQSLCASDVLTSIAAGGGDLPDVLGFCPLSVTVDRK